MNEFQPPPFEPHPVFRGGHLQTIVSIGATIATDLVPTQHVVPVSDGDAIVLHEDRPSTWRVGDGSILLVHGLTGCHGATYMLRLAQQFMRQGICVFRMDMRGCGAAGELTRNLTHAGRSDDIIAALNFIANRTESGAIAAIGVSLGGNQLLRAMGRIGAGLDPTPQWLGRLDRIAVISPPIDLQRCSKNMERWWLRPYNYYFIRALMDRVPPRVKEREEYQRQVSRGRPKTLQELDDRITAPLSGFSGAGDYYAKSSAKCVTAYNPVETLVLAAANDPLVPIGCFLDDNDRWPDSTTLVISKTGGHVGFIDRKKQSWMDQVLVAWFGERQA